MTVPIIFRDVNFHIYTISPDCTIRKHGEIIPIDDIIYHSTNGFDYVLLETLSNTQRLYRLEFIMISSFHPGVQHKWEHFKVIHLDGDNKNCHIDNLDYCEDVEEWREVVYPETVKRGMYAVSSWGRVKNIVYDVIRYGTYTRGYTACVLMSSNKKSHYLTHRLVAYNFMNTQSTNSCNVINHIDGDKSNNHISNLEWVTQNTNIQHACATGLWEKKTRVTPDELDMIITLLLDTRTKGSIKLVYDSIDHTLYPHITYSVIDHIKRKQSTYENISKTYDLSKIQFPTGNRGKQSKISVIEYDMIIEMLLDPKYCGLPKNVYMAIDHAKHPNITLKIIDDIRYKSAYKHVKGSKYDLMKLEFPSFKYDRDMSGA